MRRQKREPFRYETLTDNEFVYRARQRGQLVCEPGRGYRLIDLFCGAGGMTLGFTEAFGQVFVPVWANDFNPYAAKTYATNFGCHCTTEDILEIVEKRTHEIPNADVVIGGPPCQGFSLLNKQRDNDPRKQLWRPFLQVVQHTGAKVFVMENVPQLLGSEEHEQIAEVAHSMDFKMAFAKLCAADYGVPQTRWRAFIIGSRTVHPSSFFPPKKTHRRPDDIETGLLFSEEFDIHVSRARPWRTVRDAIANLPPPVGTEIRNEPPPLDPHFGRTPTPMSVERYKAIPKEAVNDFNPQIGTVARAA